MEGLGKAAGIVVEKVVLEGNPAQVIVNFASENSIDLIDLTKFETHYANINNIIVK